MNPAHRDVAPAPDAARRRTSLRLGLAALLIFLATGGGRIVGSDEVTMLELSRSLLHGRIDVPVGATTAGSGGRIVSKNAAGQAVLALPLVVFSRAAEALPLAPARRALAERALVSLFNAFVTAAVLAAFYGAARALGATGRSACGATVLLGFTTPLWVYSKSFMAEPLEALGLVLALGGAARSRTGDANGPRAAGLGALLAISSKLSTLPLVLAALTPLLGVPRSRWRWPLAGFALALAGHGFYDFARFGTPFETGYGAQATPAAYTTPLLAGLYGLLLSSGKGVMWFAPALWLVPAGIAVMGRGARLDASHAVRDQAAARRAAALAIGLTSVIALLLYGRFQHWAGDGSYGPRYLVPLLPIAFLPVAFALQRASRPRRIAGALLGALGLWVAIGGVAIYFGVQMRVAGDYPYTLPLEHPHFMESSHFNPRFSPILGHWQLLERNLALQVSGHAPRLGAGVAGDPRLGIDAGDQRALLNGLDFWWTYASYAGLPLLPLALVALLLLAGGLVALRAAWRSAAAEGG